MAPIKPVHGITPETFKRLALDAGVVYVNYGLPTAALLGATRGGNGFKIEDENRQMPIDGTPGDVKGDKRRVNSKVTLSVNLLEITTDAIKKLLPGSTSIVDGGTKDKITRSAQISAGDYLDNITLVLAKNDTTELFAFKLKNALALNGLDFGAAEDDETVLAMEFTAHYDPSDLVNDPWEIFNPLESAIVRYTCTYIAGDHGSIIGDGLQTVASGADAEAVYAAPDALYKFDNWSDTSAINPRKDTNVTANINVTANFSLI